MIILRSGREADPILIPLRPSVVRCDDPYSLVDIGHARIQVGRIIVLSSISQLRELLQQNVVNYLSGAGMLLGLQPVLQVLGLVVSHHP
jgi:hypothetical protein